MLFFTKGLMIMKFWVLCGGEGGEREVSLNSGEAVAKALLEKDKDAELVDLRSRQEACSFIEERRDGFAFIALHGGWGEDGRLQAALEMAGLPFSGSRHGACALAMDKGASKALFRDRGLLAPEGVEVRRSSGVQRPSDSVMAEILKRSGRLVVKPCRSGSSVGVSILEGDRGLEAALNKAFQHDERVLLEAYIPGREIAVTVWEGQEEAACMPAIEICPRGGLYDYSSKYTPGASEYLVPAPLSVSVFAEVEHAALGAYKALGCGAFARVDLRLDEEDRPFLLEVNTVPGMTSTSLVPKAAAAAGLSFGDFLIMVAERSLSL